MTCMLTPTIALSFTVSRQSQPPYKVNPMYLCTPPLHRYRGASCSVPVTGCVLTASADGIISRVS